MNIKFVHSTVLFLILILFNTILIAQPTELPFLVIVNTKNEITSIDRKLLTEIFLKKTTKWSNGEVVKPVDREPNSPIRHNFSETVLNRSISEVKNYWVRHIFTGQDLPPPELDRDSKVIDHVISNVGGIGYISSDANIQNINNIRVLTVK